MGLFQANTPLLADLNLLFQIAVFILLICGWYLKSKRMYVKHGTIMGSSLVLHTISIVGVMVPSLLGMGGIFQNLSSRFALVMITHSILGGLVEILGVWLVGRWILSTRQINLCFRRKNTMRIVTSLWLLELLIGFYAYLSLYII